MERCTIKSESNNNVEVTKKSVSAEILTSLHKPLSVSPIPQNIVKNVEVIPGNHLPD